MAPKRKQGDSNELDKHNHERRVRYKPAMRHMAIDESYSDEENGMPSHVQKQFGRMSLVHPAMHDGMQEHLTQHAVATGQQDGSPLPKNAKNWTRIFEHLYPNHKYVLDIYRGDPNHLVSFIRSFFAFTELAEFVNLNAIADEPDVGPYLDALAAKGPLRAESGDPDPSTVFRYKSFEEWLADFTGPRGWTFDEETNRTVPYTFWLARQKEKEAEYIRAKEEEKADRVRAENTAKAAESARENELKAAFARMSVSLERFQIDDDVMMMD